MDSRILKIGLLGCGTISQFAHLPALMRARGARLTALCDAGADLVKVMGARAGVESLFTDHSQFLEKADIDAVLIAVPDEFHFTLAQQAFAAGKHVLVEKPLAANSHECASLSAMVQRSGLKLQVGYMKRYDPGIAFAHQFIKQRLGEVSSASAWYRDSLFRYAVQEAILPPVVTSSQAIRPSRNPKTDDRRRYSLFTHGAHVFDTLRFLAGNIAAVTTCLVEKFDQYSWHGLVHYEGGALGHFELSVKVNDDYTEGYVVEGRHGCVQIRTFLPFYCRPSEVRAFDARTQQWHTPLGSASNPYKNQIEAFARSVVEDCPADPDATEGWAAVQVLEAVEESVNSGSRVEVGCLQVKC